MASALHGRRRIAKVTLYEADSAALFAHRVALSLRKGFAGSDDSGYEDGSLTSEWVGLMACQG